MPSGFYSLGLGLNGIDAPIRGANLSFLNQFPNSKAAYSLKDLNGNDPNVVTARKVGGSQTFTASQMGAELEEWAGGNDAFVETWFDQSGNNRNATQTTLSYQPKIVSSGSYLGELQFDGVDDHLLCETVLFDTDDLLSVHLVAKLSDVTSRRQTLISYIYNIQSAPSSANGFAIEQKLFNLDRLGGVADPDYWTGSNPVYNDNYLVGSNVSSTSYILHSLQLNNSTVSLFQNSNLIEVSSSAGMSSTRVAFWQRLRIGGDEGLSQAMNGSIKEAIIYNSDQSTNRQAIENSINKKYKIYS